MQDLQDKTNQMNTLADIFEAMIDKFTQLLETTSEYPAVRNISYANQIGTEFMGKPKSSGLLIFLW
jgi:hypothetical protein